MTLHKVVTVSKNFEPGVERTEYIFSPWSSNVLEMQLKAQCPGLLRVSVESAPPETTALTPMLESGDIVQVHDGKFNGCILDLVAITPSHTFICRNDTMGTLEPGWKVPVIRTRAVSFYRKPATPLEY